MEDVRRKAIIVFGSIPSKKNSRLIFSRGGRVVNIPSNKYRDWHRQAAAQLFDCKGLLNKTISRMEIHFFFETKRRADLTNKAESLMDLLVDLKIIADDSWQIVPRLDLISGGVDKINPRAEIIFHYSDGETAKTDPKDISK